MKRFYKDVTVAEAAGAYRVLLGGKPLKTPAKAVLALPTRALAEAIADEWREQGLPPSVTPPDQVRGRATSPASGGGKDGFPPPLAGEAPSEATAEGGSRKAGDIDPSSMPLTRLAFAAIDAVAAHRQRLEADILGYGRADLLCYRADSPGVLVRRQAESWDPLLAWAGERFGARLDTGAGIAFVEQPAASLAAFAEAVSDLDPFALVALRSAASLTGSLVLALALTEGRLDAAEAFRLSRLDEDFQADTWGRDAEAESRAARLARELAAIARFLRLLGDS